MKRGGRLFVSAPTGTGKTMAALFPAVRALGSGEFEKVFYLTASGTGAQPVVYALRSLSKGGALIRAVSLTAKEKICSRGAECGYGKNRCRCLFMSGSREEAATHHLISLGIPVVTRADLVRTAQKFNICPYELSLQYSLICDFVVCDYNYLFDLRVFLRRYFSDKGNYCFLIDEAHNLVSRARDMYSASFSSGLFDEIHELVAQLHEVLPQQNTDASLLAQRFSQNVKTAQASDSVHKKFTAPNGGGGELLSRIAALKSGFEDHLKGLMSDSISESDENGGERKFAHQSSLPQGAVRYIFKLEQLIGQLILGNSKEAGSPKSQKTSEHNECASYVETVGHGENIAHTKSIQHPASAKLDVFESPTVCIKTTKGAIFDTNTSYTENANSNKGNNSAGGASPVSIVNPAGGASPNHRRNSDGGNIPREFIKSPNNVKVFEVDVFHKIKNLYYSIQTFTRIAALYDKRFESFISMDGNTITLKLFCIDPSSILRSRLALGRSAIFFSATLTPIDYYRAILGCAEGDMLVLDSPFDQSALCIAALDKIPMRYSSRNESIPAVIDAVYAAISKKTGNYMIFCPSFGYMNNLHSAWKDTHHEIRSIIQKRNMTNAERVKFIAEFSDSPIESMVAFCVLGGIYSEGIDLVGERLIGAIVVGVGLPELSVEGEAIAAYYDREAECGREYAYIYPGMNRVMQAAGRVIRTENDKGILILIDERFSDEVYRRIVPSHWHKLKYASNSKALGGLIERFWTNPK